jgi:dTDP-4-amino-4,6-dideoxygalactose transaminase
VPQLDWKVPFYRHDLGRAELAAVAEVLRGDILTTGDAVAEVERLFASLLHRRHALAVTSCTGALHMALLAHDIGPGDEVITTPMTFVATATAIIEAGATPVFVDVEPDTGNLDARLIEAAITPRTKAILPVHLYGLMCDMRAIKAIADKHSLVVIEDAAHCIEGVRDGVRPGELSAAACFSFYATKNLTCGEGGAIAGDDQALFERLKLQRLHGLTRSAAERARDGYQHWDMVAMGWKYNMSNIEAALLLPQFARVEQKLARREELARRYHERLAAIPGIVLPASRSSVVHARHLYTIWSDVIPRDRLIARLHEDRIGAVVNYRAVHLMSYFVEKYGHRRQSFPNAEWIGDRTLSLPFYPDMPDAHVDIVSAAVASAAAQWHSERSAVQVPRSGERKRRNSGAASRMSSAGR